MPTVVVRFLNHARKIPFVVRFIIISTNGLTAYKILLASVCRLLLGMKLQGQSGWIILIPVASISK